MENITGSRAVKCKPMVNSTLIKVDPKKQKIKYNKGGISYFINQVIESKIPLDLWGPEEGARTYLEMSNF